MGGLNDHGCRRHETPLLDPYRRTYLIENMKDSVCSKRAAPKSNHCFTPLAPAAASWLMALASARLPTFS